jgi:hypothetical protein
VEQWSSGLWRRAVSFAVCLRSLTAQAVWYGRMKFIVEIPDHEVFEAAEQPEDLACEIAEVIASQIFDFSSLVVIPQRKVNGTVRARFNPDSRVVG